MNQPRPPLARQHTRSTEERRVAKNDRGVRFGVGDDIYEVRVGDLSGLDSLEFRRQVGVPFAKVMDEVEDNFDIDYLAALMWIARRVAGESALTYVEIASEVGYDLLESVRQISADEGGEVPEA